MCSTFLNRCAKRACHLRLYSKLSATNQKDSSFDCDDACAEFIKQNTAYDRRLKDEHSQVINQNTASDQQLKDEHSQVINQNTASDRRLKDEHAEFIKQLPKRYSVVPKLRGKSIIAHRCSNTLDQNRPYKPIDKRMSDSYVEEYLPFKSDSSVKDDYVNVYGRIRIGKVFEDLDALVHSIYFYFDFKAGSIAYSHCDDLTHEIPPVIIVTASVNRMDLLTPFFPSTEDIKLSGFVSYVGFSSMEVSILVETCPEGSKAAIQKSIANRKLGNWPHGLFEKKHGNPILVAKFTMVARDPTSGKSCSINSLILENDFERQLFEYGQEQKKKKERASLKALTIAPPSVDEMYLIHELHLETQKYMDPSNHTPKPDNIIYMASTMQKTISICMPQDRNIHNNIFGGYLMRKAFELAHVTSILFAGSQPSFFALDNITFKRPVPIGALLSLTSQIVYTSNTDFSVRVIADIVDPFKALYESTERTNEFYFSFRVNDGIIRRVLPCSYEEGVRYIEGKRRKELGELEREHTRLMNL